MAGGARRPAGGGTGTPGGRKAPPPAPPRGGGRPAGGWGGGGAAGAGGEHDPPDPLELRREAAALRERLDEQARLHAEGMIDGQQLAAGSASARAGLKGRSGEHTAEL